MLRTRRPTLVKSSQRFDRAEAEEFCAFFNGGKIFEPQGVTDMERIDALTPEYRGGSGSFLYAARAH